MSDVFHIWKLNIVLTMLKPNMFRPNLKIRSIYMALSGDLNVLTSGINSA